MNYFSYLDTTFRTIHLNFDSHLTEEAEPYFTNQLKLYNNSNKHKALIINYIKDEVFKKDFSLWILHAHEYCHFLQTFFYPYIYLSSYFQYKALITVQSQIYSRTEDILIDNIWFIPEINESFYFNNYQVPFYWIDNELIVGSKNQKMPEARLFCINDFVENATSIFQFQFTGNNKKTPKEYFNWINNPANKGYKNVYMFLVKKVGEEKAYNMIRKITQLMFRTTEPIPVFLALVNYWIQNHSDEDDLDYEYLEVVIKQTLNKAVEQINVSEIFSVNKLPNRRYIGFDEFVNILDETNDYPISHLARFLINQYNTFEEYNDYLININHEKFFELYYKSFNPHITQYHLKDLNSNYKPIIEVYDSYQSIEIKINDKNYGSFYSILNEAMKVANISFEIIKRKSDNIIPMNCSLQECPYYNLKLCRTWTSLPQKYEDCSFPSFFQLLFNKKIDVENRKLIHTSLNYENLEIQYQEKYEKNKRISSVNYQIQEDRIILFVPIEELKKNGKAYFSDFINILVQVKDFKIEDLLGKVFIQFMDFENDSRDIFEILEIKDWMKSLKEEVPELFYYLNWEYDLQHSPYVVI